MATKCIFHTISFSVMNSTHEVSAAQLGRAGAQRCWRSDATGGGQVYDSKAIKVR